MTAATLSGPKTKTTSKPKTTKATTAVVIPFRDRGVDPLRKANLERVLAEWEYFGAEVIVSDDGRNGSSQFNRSAAYNRGLAKTDADVIVFSEADMLIDHTQITKAVDAARTRPGLVIPFSQYRYLTQDDSEKIRSGDRDAIDCIPESTMDNGSSIGAINVVSRRTISAIGQWDEAFEGSWYDDNAMALAFQVCAGPTRWINGPAFHLFHQPGWIGDHLTPEDIEATRKNQVRFTIYRRARTPERIRELTAGGA